MSTNYPEQITIDCGGFVNSLPRALERFTEPFFIRRNRVSGFQIPISTVADYCQRQ